MGIGLLPSVSLLHIPPFSPFLPGLPSLSSFHSQLHLQKCLWDFYFYFIFSSHLRLSLIQEGLKHSMRRGLLYHRGSRRKVWSQPCRLRSDRMLCFSVFICEFGLWFYQPTHTGLQQLKVWNTRLVQFLIFFVWLLPNILCIELPSLSVCVYLLPPTASTV